MAAREDCEILQVETKASSDFQQTKIPVSNIWHTKREETKFSREVLILAFFLLKNILIISFVKKTLSNNF